MDAFVKLQDVALNGDFETAEDVGSVRPSCFTPADPSAGARALRQSRKADKLASLGVSHAVLPGGKTTPLLKTMLTTACERNCNYCMWRAGRSGTRRTTFQPDEMATAFMQMHRAGVVEGLFLSSGIIGGGAKTQDRLLDTIDLVRNKHAFKGYIHLKVMPGAEKAQVFRAMQLATRLSVNLEAPNPERLAALAPRKDFTEELLQPLRWMEEIRQTQPASQAWNGRWASSVTQFVVGACGESDLELLSASHFLISKLKLGRAYYRAFSPVVDTPLENHPAENPLREHRLYQASFLFRDYGFDLEEMPFTQDGRLPLDKDPKQAWAEVELCETPVEVNRAGRDDLLRVPGIGSTGAMRILNARRRGTLRSEHDLQQIGVRTGRLRPFVLLDGKRPTFQLPLKI